MKVTATIRVMSEVDALRTAVVLAMERLCFASAESFGDELPSDGGAYASVTFSGPHRGAVALTMPNAMLASIVEAIVPPDVTIDASDVIAELANIVCGNVVPRIFGRGEVYPLALPTPARPEAGEVATAVVHFEHGWIAATLYGAPS